MFSLKFRKRTHQNTSIAIFLSDKIVTLRNGSYEKSVIY